MRDLTLPVTFRQEILQPLLAGFITGRSCSLVGVGSSGKSNAVRHLNRPDVRELYLGEAAQYVLSLYVNCTKLTETAYTARGLYCLILEVMTKAVKEAQPDVAALYSKLRALWKEAIDSEAADLARSNLEDAFDAVFQAGIAHIFITFDDFDPVVTRSPASVLNSLRALRDDYKTQLVYVTVTRRELGFLRDPNEIEDFLELVVPNTMAIGPYSEADARFMIKRLAMREIPSRTFSNEERGHLLEISGRHAGLLTTIYKATQDKIPLTAGDLLDRLRAHPAIEEECEKIWASLEADEQDDLEALISQVQLAGKGVKPLLKKGIIRERPDGTYDIFSPVFADFVAGNLRREQVQIQLLPEQRQAKINNQVIGELNEIEYRLFSYLFNQHPEPVTQEQLLQEMLAAEARQPKASGPPGRRLDVYLNEIKRKIEFDQEYILRLSDGRYKLGLGRR